MTVADKRGVEARLNLAEVRLRAGHETLRGRIHIDHIELLVGDDHVHRRGVERLLDAFAGDRPCAIRFGATCGRMAAKCISRSPTAR